MINCILQSENSFIHSENDSQVNQLWGLINRLHLPIQVRFVQLAV